ncbi:helicase C-terminal domain-containing protein [Synechococcus sp. PCC 7336]|uniref:helicase C-terminal domain-containing protein n=1 Tax=Synechococcus sp. PCC 7336 TaxID=195250 RepID=UPI0003498714|nr:helicase C-terminal domain-containing protein [Synechococcus sp. PCC 7336]
MIEVEVHQHLRRLLRQRRSPTGSVPPDWPHQLTMARLVARGLRLQRHALIQVPTGDAYRLSYLLPALMWPGATLICAPTKVQAQLIYDGVPQLQSALDLRKPVLQGDRFPAGFEGVLLVEPQVWLHDRLWPVEGSDACFPRHIPVIVDRAESLEDWAQQALTVTLAADDWHHLEIALPHWSERLRAIRMELLARLCRRPPVQFLLHGDERVLLAEAIELAGTLEPVLPLPWARLQQQWQQPDWVLWAEKLPSFGQFLIHLSPVRVGPILARQLWPTQSVVTIGEALDLDKTAFAYRQRLGLPELTALKFLPDRRDRPLYLYTPTPFPAPNNPQFRDRLLSTLAQLVARTNRGPVVVLVSDRPLHGQVGTALAAEFGSRVKVNAPYHPERGVLVCDWDYWLANSDRGAAPVLMAIATLPFPTMEHPLVAGRVNYLKQLRQDWFRNYLLPMAASYLQRAVGVMRGLEGVVAILDIRAISRSYGKQLLESLAPTLSVSERDLAEHLELSRPQTAPASNSSASVETTD